MRTLDENVVRKEKEKKRDEKEERGE